MRSVWPFGRCLLALCVRVVITPSTGSPVREDALSIVASSVSSRLRCLLRSVLVVFSWRSAPGFWMDYA